MRDVLSPRHSKGSGSESVTLHMSIVTKRSTMAFFSDARDHYCHRVRMVLAEKGVTVEVIDIDPNNKPEELGEVNPYNSLPTLLDRDLVLYEANVIMEYLDERFPHPPLLPVYPVQRALSRLWISRIDKEWSTKMDVLMTGKGRETLLDKARKELRESLLAVAPIFNERPFFMNDEFSLVDCCVVPLLWRLKEVDIVLPERTAKPMLKYMNTMFERPGFRESLTEAELEMRE